MILVVLCLVPHSGLGHAYRAHKAPAPRHHVVRTFDDSA